MGEINWYLFCSLELRLPEQQLLGSFVVEAKSRAAVGLAKH